MVKKTRILSAAAILGAALSIRPAPLCPEAAPFGALPEEAASSLFDVELESGDAELFIRGSWELSLLGTAGLVITPNGALGLAEGQPLLFKQNPDLFLSFLLLDRWFVEARVSSDASQTRYAAGYRGGEGELLQEARIGNVGISFPELPFISFGEGSPRSFGAALRLAAQGFSGQAMLRYDQADRVVRTYLGQAELAETIIPASSFITGRWFLTAGGSASNLVLYIASASGSLTGSDGRRYRRLAPEEYSYSSTTGYIALGTAATTRVAAHYSGAMSEVTIDGESCVILCDPEERNGTALVPRQQILSRYAAAGTVDEVFVRNRATGLKDEKYEARYNPAGYVEVIREGLALPDAAALQPFAVAMPGLYTRDPDEESPAFAPLLTHEIVLRRVGRSSEILVDKDLVLGSVEVTRNGVRDYAFSVDLEKGVLNLADPAGMSEEIVVTYLRESAERRAGSLAAGLAGIFGEEEGAQAWLVLAGRLGLPGTSYAAAGSTNPGSLVLSGGLRGGGGKLQYRIAAAGSLSTEEASGRYRIAGMESSGNYGSSFAPTGGSLPAGFTLSETTESRFAADFPRLALDLHRDGSVQAAVRIVVTDPSPTPVAAKAEFAAIQEPMPLGKLKTFVFFARRSDVSPQPDSRMTLRLDDGSDSPILSVSVPLNAIDATWNRYSFVYAEGAATLYRQSGEAGDAVVIGSATVSYSAAIREPRRLAITVEGAAPGLELWLDEVLLEDSRGRLAFESAGKLEFTSPELRVGPRVFPIISGFSFAADGSAAFQDSPYAAGNLRAGTRLAGIALEARVRGHVGGGTAKLRGGHTVELPASAFPLRLKEIFDYDPELGGFGREDSLGLLAGGTSLRVEQKNAWFPGNDQTLGQLSQEWKGSLGASPILEVELRARQRSRPSNLSLGPGYFDAWRESLPYLLPAEEDSAEAREIGLSAGLGMLNGGTLFKGGATTMAEPGTAALRRNELTLRVSAPLGHAEGLRLEPYYLRTWKEQRPGAGSGLWDLAELATTEMVAAPLWTQLPLAELFSPEARAAFADYSAAVVNATTATLSYVPELGLSITRPYSSRWTDLLIPSTLNLFFKREFLREADSLHDSLNLGGRVVFSSLNLFGSAGSRPLSRRFETDEYLSSIQASIGFPDQGGTQSWELILQELATFYADAGSPGSRLGLEHRAAFSQKPSQGAWSDRLSLELNRFSPQHWLLDLFEHAKIRKGSASASGGKRILSAYLAEIAGAKPRARSIYTISTEFSGTRNDESGRRFGFTLSESYEARLSIPERLSVSAKLALSQARNADSGILTLGMTASLGMTLSF